MIGHAYPSVCACAAVELGPDCFSAGVCGLRQAGVGGPTGGGLLSNVLKPFDAFGKPLDAKVVASDKQAVPGGVAGLPACYVTDGAALVRP